MRAEKIKNVVLYVYEFFLFIIFPLWIPNGYSDLAGDKYDVFMAVSIIVILILLVIKIASMIVNGVKAFASGSGIQFPVSLKSLLFDNHWLILLPFFILLTISSLLSDYRQQSFMGSGGWYLGLFTYTVYFFIVIALSTRSNWNKKVSFSFQLAGSILVNIMAVLNRFHIYPVKGIENVRYFISSIGNSNWYAGYLCIFLFLNAGFFIAVKKMTRRANLILLLYICTGAFCLFSCGSQSVYVFLFAFFLMASVYALTNQECIKKLLMVFICFGLAAEVFSFSYSTIFINDDSIEDSLITALIRHHTGVVIILIATFLLILLSKKNIGRQKNTLKLRAFTMAVLLILPLILLVLQLYPTSVFSDEWGNGRGFIWNISRQAFYSLSSKQKLFGIGPDCLSYYLYSHQDFRSMLYEVYGNSILTNSHSILLNNLLNWGIVPSVMYLAAYASTIILSCRTNSRYTPVFTCLLVSMFFYGTITFDNLLYTPFTFYIMGISLYLLKKEQR